MTEYNVQLLNSIAKNTDFSSPHLLQSKPVEDPVAILQAAHTAAKVWPWLQPIVALVASPLCFRAMCVLWFLYVMD